MKLYIILTILLTLGAALTPFVSVFNHEKPQAVQTEQFEPESESAAEEALEKEPDTSPATIKVLRTGSGKIVEKEIFEYVKGAVAAEMPPTYEKEALKAQAVACYTYALWLKENSESFDVRGADVSDSPIYHQGFLDDDELRDKWGEKFEEYMTAISEAVSAVIGEYLEYNGEPIMACYHSISTGKTESAENAWGTDVPYLQSVRADGDILSPDIDSSITLSDEQFREAAQALEGAELSENSKEWVKKPDATDSGYVTKISIGSKEFSGSDVRSAFSLKSPAFTIKKTEKGFLFSVKGYGHLVGMSQYSADYMARQGSDYKDILLHFYKGATLKKSQA